MKLIMLFMITVVAVGVVLIMNGTPAADCTAPSTWASPSVTHCTEEK